MLHTIPLGIVSSTAAAYLIEQSLLFNDGDSAYLNRTPSSAGNRKTWTWSAWVKLAELGRFQHLFNAYIDANNYSYISVNNSNEFVVSDYAGGSTVTNAITNAILRDTSAWYHLVVAYDSTQATASNRLKIYINGTLASLRVATYQSLNYDSLINSTTVHNIGNYNGSAGIYDGLMALPILVDGAAQAPSAFGETDDDGFWNPIEFTGTTTVLPATLSTDQVPTLNSGSSGWDQSETFTGNPSSFGGWAAFDNNFTSGWITGSSATGWMEYQFASAKTITGYSLVCSGPGNTETRAPKNWTIQGSNTGAFTGEEDTLATVTNQTSWGAGAGDATRRYFAIDTPGSYDYYRINVTANNGASTPALAILEMEYFEEETLLNSFGTNGFQLDFADSSNFGKDVAVDDTSTTTPSASGQWTVGTANVTFTGDDYVFNAGDDAMYSANTFAVADWPMRYVVTMDNAGTLDNGSYAVGLFDNAEIGTFNHQGSGGAGGMGGMTKSWGVTPRTGVLTYGGATQATIGALGNSSVAEFVIEADGTVRFYLNNVLKHEFTQKADGITVRFAAASSNAGLDYVDAYWQTNFPLFYRANNFTASDQLADTPTDSSGDGIGNFATFNPLNNTRDGGATLSNGNLNYSATAGNSEVPGTIVIPEDTTDTWVIEFTNVSLGSNRPAVGLIQNSIIGVAGVTGGASEVAYNNGGITINTVGQGSITTDATIRFEYNGTDNEVEVFTAGVSRGTYSWTPAGPFTFYAARAAGTATCSINTNISLMEGTVTAGAKSFGTQNLPAPTIADGSQYFNTVLYTGNGTAIGSGGNAITGVGFQPDFVWIKGRDTTFSHQLYDVIRGPEKPLNSNNTGAESSNTEVLTAFTSDGFTVGSNSGVNQNTKTYVGWCWKAGGSASSNTDGSITTSVSVNTTSGFSIISYTGNATAGATLGHGLSSAPKFIIGKNRDNGANNWGGYHVSLGGTHRIFPDNTTAAQNDDGNWNDTNPTASVITLGNGGITNSNTDDFIMYAWAEVDGFSKFGSYTGNGSADGPFIYTGFRPAFVMVKRTNSAGNWAMLDNKRNSYNPVDIQQVANNAAVDATGVDYLDFLSNGFKHRSTNASFNASGGTYIYAAFAENPFQGDDGATQARAR